ncbi:MAG: cytochrome c-type biogenesis protein [Pseudomonadota bacterium]
MIATRRWMVLLAALLLSAGAGAIDTEAAFADAARQARYEHLTNELRCLVCQNQTIADSNAGLAGDLRREVKELIAAGKTDDEIRQFLTARYGDFVLYNPPLTARTLLLWAAPALLVLVTVGAAARVIVRRSKAPIDADPEDMV